MTFRDLSDGGLIVPVCPFPKTEHEDDYPVVCPECLARFRSEREMSAHRQTHAIQTFPCDDCKLVFYTEPHLGDHMAQFHVTLNSSSG